jgi:hypothetical protein
MSIDDIDAAVAKAKQFAVRAGFLDVFLALRAVNLVEKKWVVTLDYTLATKPTQVTVELDQASGKTVGFKKVEQQ